MKLWNILLQDKEVNLNQDLKTLNELIPEVNQLKFYLFFIDQVSQTFNLYDFVILLAIKFFYSYIYDFFFLLPSKDDII